MAEHGYSRDGKPRDRQVLVGVVMVDGWPITHHVFRGKLRDSQTVATVLDDLQQRFGLRRVVFVGDRGMVTIENLKLLRDSEQGYIVGLTRRRREEVYRYVERATGPWLECPVGIVAREAKSPPPTKVQEVPSDQPGVRVFVVHSDERLAYERSQLSPSCSTEPCRRSSRPPASTSLPPQPGKRSARSVSSRSISVMAPPSAPSPAVPHALLRS
jgi:hypothetical protein